MAGANLGVVCADGCPAERGSCGEGQPSSDKAGLGLQTLSSAPGWLHGAAEHQQAPSPCCSDQLYEKPLPFLLIKCKAQTNSWEEEQTRY